MIKCYEFLKMYYYETSFKELIEYDEYEEKSRR